jgi:hypothetical protein
VKWLQKMKTRLGYSTDIYQVSLKIGGWGNVKAGFREQVDKKLD